MPAEFKVTEPMVTGLVRAVQRTQTAFNEVVIQRRGVSTRIVELDAKIIELMYSLDKITKAVSEQLTVQRIVDFPERRAKAAAAYQRARNEGLEGAASMTEALPVAEGGMRSTEEVARKIRGLKENVPEAQGEKIYICPECKSPEILASAYMYMNSKKLKGDTEGPMELYWCESCTHEFEAPETREP